MSSEKALFISVSGMRGTGRSNVFKGLQRRLPELLPDKRIAFYPGPFANLEHPLIWAGKLRQEDPVTRLIRLWADLNEFNVGTLGPALKGNDIVITEGYGLNAVLFATACVDCDEADAEVARVHHDLVKSRILAKDISPPLYIITKADVPTVSRYLQGVTPGLDELRRQAFIKKEAKIIENYFRPGTGQTCVSLDARLTHEEMTDAALQFVIERASRNGAKEHVA
jgi:hypothetical protein